MNWLFPVGTAFSYSVEKNDRRRRSKLARMWNKHVIKYGLAERRLENPLPESSAGVHSMFTYYPVDETSSLIVSRAANSKSVKTARAAKAFGLGKASDTVVGVTLNHRGTALAEVGKNLPEAGERLDRAESLTEVLGRNLLV